MSYVPDDGRGWDLVVAAIAGVQGFVTESRRTADLLASSALIEELSAALVEVVKDPAEMLLPAAGASESTPNRVVARAPQGRGRELAEAMQEAVRRAWSVRSQQVGGTGTPGFPLVRWVVVPPLDGGYEAQWARAGRLLAGRKTARDFQFPVTDQARVCTLTGRWPSARSAGDRPGAEPRRQGRELVESGEHLSTVALVKRKYAQGKGFPSTWSIATAGYRADLIRALAYREDLRMEVGDLREAVGWLADWFRETGAGPLRTEGGVLRGIPASGTPEGTWLRSVEGAWCVPETWDADVLRHEYGLRESPDRDVCALGRQAAAELRAAAIAAGLVPPSPYLAVLAQDADRLGQTLGDPRNATGPGGLRGWHERMSYALGRAAEGQREVVDTPDVVGRVVYAGGDDLLALLPLASALRATRQCYGRFRSAVGTELPDGTVSSALVFFHASSPLQPTIGAAHQLLDDAKEHGRPGLGIAVLRRGGERARWVGPWAPPGDGAPGTPRTAGALQRLATFVEALMPSPDGPDGPDASPDTIGTADTAAGERARDGQKTAVARPGDAVGAMSARLAMDLERDEAELAGLDHGWLLMELSRRATRQGAPPSVVEALRALCGTADRPVVPTQALLVAGFLAAEGGRR